jgi:UDP-N-acetylmuramoyl-tripeptide--D-alanyl-D-alanine ligase
MIVATLSQAAQTMNGRLVGQDRSFRGVSTDTRRLRADELFVALTGPNFDGHEFVAEAAARAAAGAVVSRDTGSVLTRIEVADTLLALGDLAADWRRQMNARVVGLTGSNGKTTLKEMIASCLSLAAKTIATEGNLNNEIGVPLMLLRLAPEHEFAVIEMGANHIGEIAYLTERVSPDVVAITNAGAAHLEGFGSIEGVARGKGEILQGSQRPEFAVLNADDDYFGFWRALADDVSVLSFGLAEPATVRAVNVEAVPGGLSFDLRLPEAEIHIDLPLDGKHNAVNAAAAAAVALALDVDPETIRAGLNATRPVSGRLRALAGIRGLTVFDDSYNANPGSVRAAAEFLGARAGQGWLVLGDMAELGDEADRLHAEAGRAARAAGVSRLFAVGDHARRAAEAFGDGGLWCASIDELTKAVRAALPGNGPVNLLVKGSRSMRMERVVDAFVAPPEKQGRR